MTRAVKNRVIIPERTETPLVINGNMKISQRATSATGVSSGSTYPAVDRFMLAISDNGTFTVSQETLTTSDTPFANGFTKALKLDCTTADASVAAGAFRIIEHRFEGQDLQVLKKGTSSAEFTTVAFWVKSTKTGTFVLELEDSDNSRSISQAYTVSSSNTWERKVLSYAGDTTGDLDNDNARSFRLMFWLGAGSNFTSGSLGTSWAGTDNTKRAVGQVNSADSTDNNFHITGVQLEIGDFNADTMPEFQFEDLASNLARCRRYFHISVNADDNTTGFADGGFRTNATAQIMHQFPVSMRTAPTSAQRAVDGMIAHDLADGNNINVESIQSVLHSCEGNELIQYDLEGTSAAAGDSCYLYPTGDTPGVTFDAEI